MYLNMYVQINTSITTGYRHRINFHQDGVPLHSHDKVSSYFNCKVLTWIGCGRTIFWLLQLPDLTLMDYSMWDYIKDIVFIPPLPGDVGNLRNQITQTVAMTDADTIHKFW